jgi:hypothetical protein
MVHFDDELWPYPPEVEPYLPCLDEDWNRAEAEPGYLARMRVALPRVPDEVLREWFYRHWNDLGHYAFLDFSTLRFELQAWPLQDVPGREAFADPGFCDDFSRSFEERFKNPHDWLARYMSEHGTSNTPVILLHNLGGKHAGTAYRPLRSPWHLLEGHRRLSFLQALRRSGRALDAHSVWIASKT